MKSLLITLLVTTLLVSGMPVIAAQENEELQDAGITPDSLWYGLDVAFDRLSLLLTFDRMEKARNGLDIAQERLIEAKQMAEEHKLEAMARARDEYDKTSVRIKQRIREITDEDPEKELKLKLEIEKEFEENEKSLEELETEVEVKIKGELTEEQQELIDSLIESFKNETGKLRIEIEIEKDKTKIKYKAITEKSDEEIEQKVKELEDEVKITANRLEWAQKAIEHAEEKIAKAEQKIEEKRAEGINVSIAESYLSQAKVLIAQAKEALNLTEYRDARKLAQEAGKLAMHAKRGKSFDEKGAEKAAEEIARIIEMLQEKEIKGMNVSAAIETLTRVEEKLRKLREKEKEVECTTDADCEEDERCVEGECEKIKESECTTDADCEEDKICTEGVCVIAPPVPECTTDADCDEDERCVEGECEKTKELECTTDADCEEDERCMAGRCIPAGKP